MAARRLARGKKTTLTRQKKDQPMSKKHNEAFGARPADELWQHVSGNVQRATLLAQFDQAIAHLSSIASDFSEGSNARWLQALQDANSARDRLYAAQRVHTD